ncbi:MAG: hypothetical protein AAF599_12505 [Bacteroidota bacterium]
MKNTTILLFAIISLLLISCEKGQINSSADHLFPNTEVLNIYYQSGATDLPIFDVSEVTSQLIYIGIFEEIPIVENQRIINTGALVWHWNSGVDPISFVEFSDGIIDQADYELAALVCKDSVQLYWAAWTWEETQVSHSTPVQEIKIKADPLSRIEVQKIEFASNGDDLFTAGERLNMILVLENTGTESAEDVYVELSHPEVEDLPKSQFLEQINTNTIAKLDFSFTLPKQALLGDSLLINIEINHSGCVEEPMQQYALVVDGKRLYLQSVKLLNIYSNPDPWATWDPFKVHPYTNPDPYFVLSTSVTEELYRSDILYNVDSRIPNVAWSDLSSGFELNLNESYSIKVLDDDPDTSDGDDLVGDVIFSPAEWLANSAEAKIVRSSSVLLRLELIWE